MSRAELDAIQTKLKTAIQNHQKLVVKMKDENQNAVFKTKLKDLQDEIKKLSEEQKKLVLKLRESLVKSTVHLSQQSAVMTLSQQQTITAIGQPRLVSFPTQGAATILPVGMVALPIAHMQRPAMAVQAPAGHSGVSIVPVMSGLAGLGATLLQASTVASPTNGLANGTDSGLVSLGGCLISLGQLVNKCAATTSSATLSTGTAVTSSTSGVLVSPFPQQPLVQTQVLQQQQQQILQLIQHQQQQSVQQFRQVSQLPIKVPHYLASNSSTVKLATSSSGQLCSIAPAPSATTASSGPTHSKTSTRKENHPAPKAVKDKPAKSESGKHQREQQCKNSTNCDQQPSAQQMAKRQFMKTLDLYSPQHLQEMLIKRSERKRRTTANPQYSIGFEVSQRGRNTNVWNSVKRAKVRNGKSDVGYSPGVPLTSQLSQPKYERDGHEDYCAACGKGGPLLMCETCQLVYHLDCLNPPLTQAPRYAWSCPKCLVSGRGLALLNRDALNRVHSYIASRAAKEEEKRKIQRKSGELANEKAYLTSRSKQLDMKMKSEQLKADKLSREEKQLTNNLEAVTNLVKACHQNAS